LEKDGFFYLSSGNFATGKRIYAHREISRFTLIRRQKIKNLVDPDKSAFGSLALQVVSIKTPAEIPANVAVTYDFSDGARVILEK
jgi:hypothetical protein